MTAALCTSPKVETRQAPPVTPSDEILNELAHIEPDIYRFLTARSVELTGWPLWQLSPNRIYAVLESMHHDLEVALSPLRHLVTGSV